MQSFVEKKASKYEKAPGDEINDGTDAPLNNISKSAEKQRVLSLE